MFAFSSSFTPLGFGFGLHEARVRKGLEHLHERPGELDYQRKLIVNLAIVIDLTNNILRHVISLEVVIFVSVALRLRFERDPFLFDGLLVCPLVYFLHGRLAVQTTSNVFEVENKGGPCLLPNAACR
jgi:hypothetical protein